MITKDYLYDYYSTTNSQPLNGDGFIPNRSLNTVPVLLVPYGRCSASNCRKER